jgi:energy-coupling factor transport system substrate-specific component
MTDTQKTPDQTPDQNSAGTGKSLSAHARHSLDIALGVVAAVVLIVLSLLTLAKTGSAFAWVTIAIPVVLALVFWILEKRTLSPATVGIVVAVIAIACALRALRIPVQGIQFTNWLVILVGLALGAHAGFLTGALIPLISNIYLGQGSWTPWQMLAWGLLGAMAGWISTQKWARNRWAMLGWGILSSYVYGLIMNFESYLYSMGTQYATGFWKAIALGLPGDSISAAVTGVLLLITVPWAVDLIRRTYARHETVTA